jgi:hypothetical protein
MNFGSKKLFFIGFFVILLVGIPLSVYLLQQQQEVRSRAEKSTNIAFSPDSTSAAPIQKGIGDSIPLDVTVDPGKNLVDHVKLIIQYDPEILATASANAFKANAVAFPSTLEGPVYSPGKIAVSLAVGSDPTKAIQQKVTAATITFKALKNTPVGTPTLVTFTTETQVLSIGSNDQASENVLSSATPATIVIGGATTVTPTAPEGTVMPTIPASTPQPTSVSTTVAPTSVVTAVPTTPISDTGTPSTPPVCNSLTVDRETTGNSPLSITFGANGSDTDGTISKVTFNFGDSQVSDVTDSGGIGTASVNVQASHTYNNAGTYQASVVLTDSSNGVSATSDTCKQTITVTSSGSGGGGGTVNASPTMPATGSTQVAMGIGIGTLILVLGGGLLFFML